MDKLSAMDCAECANGLRKGGDIRAFQAVEGQSGHWVVIMWADARFGSSDRTTDDLVIHRY